MIPLTMIPVPWKILARAVLILAVFGVGHYYGARGVQADWNADKLARSTATTGAIVKRTQDNAAETVKHAATNATITKAKNEELASVRTRIVTERVYVGSVLCGGPAAAPEAESTGSGDSANPNARLLPPEVERDIQALILETKEAAATGRACPLWIRENGFASQFFSNSKPTVWRFLSQFWQVASKVKPASHPLISVALGPGRRCGKWTFHTHANP